MRLHRWRTAAFRGALALVALALGAAQTSAAIVPTFTGVTGTGPFTYTYNVNLTSVGSINTGTVSTADFFTLYDFNGLVGTPTITGGDGGWSVATPFLGRNPIGVAPLNDSASIPNIEVFRSGPTLSFPSGSPPFPLFTLNAVSTIGIPTGLSDYSSMTHATNGDQLNSYTPLGVESPAATTPEPASVILLGIGGPLALGLWRRRRSIG